VSPASSRKETIPAVRLVHWILHLRDGYMRFLGSWTVTKMQPTPQIMKRKCPGRRSRFLSTREGTMRRMVRAHHHAQPTDWSTDARICMQRS
jgi:hypothetical protein